MNRIFAIAALLVAVEIRASVVPPDIVAEELLKTELGFPSGSCACNEADNSELAALRAAKDSLSKALAAAKKAEFDAEQARLLRNAAFFKLGPWLAEKIASLFSFGAAKLLTPWINKFLWWKIGDVGPDAEELVTGLSDSIMDGISEWNENAALAGKTKIDVGKTDDVYSFVSWLGEMWEKAFEGFEIGEKVAAAKFTAEKAEDARAALQKKIDELETLLYKWHGNSDFGTCRCGGGCACPHCKPPESLGGGGSPPASGGGNPGGGGDSYIAKWIGEMAGRDDEDPWKPIYDGIVREGTVPSGSLLLQDVIGLGSFTRYLDEADELAKWSDAAGAYKDVAAGIWGAVTAGGSGAGTAISGVLDDVVEWGNTWLDRFLDKQSKRIGDFLMRKVAGIVAKLEALVEPWMRAMERANDKIRLWVAVSVEKWVKTMDEYAKAVDDARRDDERRGWTMVDWGFDGPVPVDAGAPPRTGGQRQNRYTESVSP